MAWLRHEGARLSYADPYVPSLIVSGRPCEAAVVTAERLARCDCALILTAHSTFDYDLIVRHAPLVFDTRNGTRRVRAGRDHVVLL